MSALLELRSELKSKANSRKAKILKGFFKTGKGEYGEGDVFLGITVPQSRKLAIKFRHLSFSEIAQLLKSPVHEERLISLLILVHNFNVGDERNKKRIYEFYLKNTKHVNNWDLVDLSADKIVGGFLYNSLGSTRSLNDSSEPSGNTILDKLVKSNNLWKRRIAMISTFYFIKNNKFDETLKIAEILLSDKHDLIHKAVGWMLREVGKRNLKAEMKFLDKHYKKMPRTMLRYAIERFPEKLRRNYLEGVI